MFFPITSRTPLKIDFWTPRVAVLPPKCDFGPISDFPGGQKSTLGAAFSRGSPGGSESATLQAVAGKPRDSPKLILPTLLYFYRFWMEFGPILDGATCILCSKSNGFITISFPTQWPQKVVQNRRESLILVPRGGFLMLFLT